MTVLAWDQVGERVFQTGVDRGVLYLQDEEDTAVVWNGLTGVEETPNSELSSSYLDGRKYLEYLSPGDYSGKLSALTYPDEFDSVTGIIEDSLGLTYHDQPAKSFGLSYRTKIGNDLDGVDHGYKLHILYNLLANPDSQAFFTLGDSVNPTEFSWNLSAKPVQVEDVRPTAHISIDSTRISPESLSLIEDTLYGSESSDPSLPSIDELIELLTPEEV